MWLEKMITKEDAFHVHKTLGFLVLCSYVFRLTQYGSADMGFATKPYLTFPTILLHLSLNLSSFEFQIPPRRIVSGYRIWPEYRFHSLVFLSRSLAIMALNYLEQVNGWDPKYTVNFIIVIVSMMSADAGSAYFGASKSIRQLEVPNYVRYFFSAMQFYATAQCMFGLRRMSVHFLFVIIIQGNAFLMTVRRKNLASHNGLIAIYGIALVGGALIGLYELSLASASARMIATATAGLVILLRLGPLPATLASIQNKYFLWTLAGYLMSRLRPLVEGDESEAILTYNQLWWIHKIASCGVGLLGWYNCAYGYAKRERAEDEKRKEL